MKKLILASKSPRRIEMMESNGYKPEIMPSDFEENVSDLLDPKEAVMYLAYRKAMDVTEKALAKADHADKSAEGFVVVAADTVVVYDNKIIGKPVDEEDAFKTLTALRDNVHDVITGVCIIEAVDDIVTATKHCFYDDTRVYFNHYTDEELREYLKTDEAYDKAGSYAIQGTFGRYIDRIEGDYENVVGFPWYRIEPCLQAKGLKKWQEPPCRSR